MAELFGKGTIKHEIQSIVGFDASKIQLINDMYQKYTSGSLQHLNESQFEQTFNQLFFGELLGYAGLDCLIPKAPTGKGGIVDVVLGYFPGEKYSIDGVQVACELKGMKVSLDKKQNRDGNLSPVQQGFTYKTSIKNCKWLIVSNFYETRLYRDNQTDFESRTIDQLADPKDDYYNLKKLYLLLHKNNLINIAGPSKTENLLSQFREEQKDITKKFYAEYKKLRIDLINDIIHHNPTVDKAVIVEKTQKIIDRLIFIFFCEDKGLLPDKKLKENIVRSQEAGFTAREVTKKFFNLVGRGSDKLGIPDGFNGGLFHEDKELDALIVGDAICKTFVELTNYDFDDKLSVNVLGHIFEQSISDLEHLKIDLLGTECDTGDLKEKQGKRKKDGIFYTPAYIVDYIVRNSLGKYLEEKEQEILTQYTTKKNDQLKAYQAYQHVVQNIKVLDPACGSGAFLVRVFDFLLEENMRVFRIIADLTETNLAGLFTVEDIAKAILTNNIYGVDLNAESVEITKLSLWLKTANKGKKLTNLDGNIKCGNSLIDDVSVAGKKAFVRAEQFPAIFADGGFDVVVGNPPYGAKFSQSDFDFFNSKFVTSEYKIDTYVLFVERAINLLKEGGKLGYIIPYTFLSGKFFSKVRLFIREKTTLEKIIVLGKGIFEDADVDTLILFLTHGKKISQDFYWLNMKSTDIEDKPLELTQGSLGLGKVGEGQSEIVLSSGEAQGILERMLVDSLFLDDLVDFYHGLQTRGDKTAMGEVPQSNDRMPILKGEDFHRYAFHPKPRFVNFIKENIKSGGDIAKYKVPKKLIMRTTGDSFVTSLDETQSICLNSVNVILQKNKEFDLRYILCALNSLLMKFRYNLIVGEQGKTFAEVKITYLRGLPIKAIPLSNQQPFIEKADKMLDLNKQLHEATDFVLRFLQSKFGLTKLSGKLEKFRELDFSEFTKQLKIKKLSLDQEADLMSFFDKKKTEILAIKGDIEKTDREIDEMVFDLYGLNEEERKVVLASNK